MSDNAYGFDAGLLGAISKSIRNEMKEPCTRDTAFFIALNMRQITRLEQQGILCLAPKEILTIALLNTEAI